MSTIAEGMHWFKNSFGDNVSVKITDTGMSIDFITAIAVQETFEVWGNLFISMPVSEVLQVCVGDVIDGPRRKVFPTSRADLLKAPNGQAIFEVARAALVAMGQHNATYHKIAEANPNKLCHGFGIFQLDIQACKARPDYFLSREWFDFDRCLSICLDKLKEARHRVGLKSGSSLSDDDLAHIAIAYNAGAYNPKRGLKQGFKDGSGRYYGELIAQYIALSRTI